MVLASNVPGTILAAGIVSSSSSTMGPGRSSIWATHMKLSHAQHSTVIDEVASRHLKKPNNGH